MNDLRKAAERALDALEDIFGKEKKDVGAINALRQALAQPEQVLTARVVITGEKPPVKTYCGGKPNYCTPEVTPHVDTVNISQERVDETAKHEHEPVAYEFIPNGELLYPHELERQPDADYIPLYTAPPISDYHEGWEEGFKAATSEHEPFIYVREDNERPFGGYEHCSEADAGAFPVYTAPPKREWVGLTDEEKYDVLEGATGDGGRVYYDTLFRSYEAKLKEKNDFSSTSE